MIDYLGKIDGNTFHGGEEKDFQLEIGSDSVLSEVQEAMIGVCVGSEIETSVNFPHDYLDDSLAGKVADFHITIKRVFIKEAITEREKLLQKLGYKTSEELEQKSREFLIEQYRMMSFELVKLSIFNQLQKIELTVPQSMVDQELMHLQAEKDFQSKKKSSLTTAINEDNYDDTSSQNEVDQQYLLAKAKQRVKLALIIMNLREKFAIEITSEELMEAIKKKNADPKVYEYLKKLYMESSYLLAKLEGEVLEDKVCRHILGMLEHEKKLIGIQEFRDLFDKSEFMP